MWHDGPCLAHLEPRKQAQAIEILGAGADLGDAARGVPFSEELLGQVLAAAPKDDSGRPVLRNASFDGATFSGVAGFDGATFSGVAGFDGATFSGTARFDGAAFIRAARFTKAKFSGGARFDRATFSRAARFSGATFDRAARFDEATFSGAARFDEATFSGAARFDEATFERAATIGPFLAERLVLDRVTFSAPVEIDVTTLELSCKRTRFGGGGHLRLRRARVDLEGVEIGRPLILSQRHEAVTGEPTTSEPAAIPHVVSLRRANVAGLVLSGMDLQACRFFRAHNLDNLKIEECQFAPRPGGRPWTQRKCLAEEHQWRQKFEPKRGWYPPECQPSIDVGDVRMLEPGAIAGLYRSLRRGRELGGDEPGAADFYYGEMEMRRRAPQTPRAERVLLGLYWFFSGYGLRAWRALTALLLVLVLTTVLIFLHGFSQKSPTITTTVPTPAGPVTVQSASPTVHPSIGQATIDSVEGAVFRNTDPQLNLTGRGIQTGLRFVGPVLLGLALLSIRGRVKR